MSKVNGKNVLAASLHENLFVPGVGEIRKELSSTASGLNKAIKMTIDEPFLLLEIEAPQARRTFTISVPLSNFKHILIDNKIVTTPPLKE